MFPDVNTKYKKPVLPTGVRDGVPIVVFYSNRDGGRDEFLPSVIRTVA